jgi:hypothetical protein
LALELGAYKAAEMVKHVKTYVSDIWRALNSGGPTERAGELDFHVEHKFSLAGFGAELFGTCDCMLYKEATQTLYVWDLKYGDGKPVDIKDNKQMLYYALGAVQSLPDRIIENIVLTIVQPRAFHREGVVRSWTATATQLGPLIRQLRVAAEEAMGNHPTATAGPHCKYCPAQYDCPASLNAAADAVETSETATPVGLTPAAMAFELRLLRRAQMNLENRLAAIEAQAMSEIRAGKIVPGWSIEHANGREEWVKSTEEVLAMGELFGVKLAKPDAITPAQARKAGMAADVVAQYSARKTGAAKLVPISTTAARKAFQNG